MFGLCALRTGSIWPAVLAHAILNLPPPTELLMVKFAAGVILAAVLIRPIGAELRVLAGLIWRWSSLAAFAGLGALGALAGLAMLAPHGPFIAAAIAIACALGLGFLVRSPWRKRADNPSAQTPA